MSRIFQNYILRKLSNTWNIILNNLSPDTPLEKMIEAVKAYYTLESFIVNYVKRESSDE